MNCRVLAAMAIVFKVTTGHYDGINIQLAAESQRERRPLSRRLISFSLARGIK